MALKVKGKVYNDGVLTVCRQVDRKTDFAARRNPKAAEDLTPIAKMAFRHISSRAEDAQLAEAMGFSLTKKVCIRSISNRIDSKCMVTIGGSLFAISYMDRTAEEDYLYLTEVRTIGS